MEPFITFYTPTYRRPLGLARNLASVQAQTRVQDIEQIVIPDHIGIGIDGMFARVPEYADAVHGRYVAFLCDDDELSGPDVVERLEYAAEAEGYPPLLVVQTRKGGTVLPSGEAWPPRMGQIDLNCAVVRRDIWQRHAGHYGRRYEGDFDFMWSLWVEGVPAVPVDLVLSVGGVSRGAAEVSA